MDIISFVVIKFQENNLLKFLFDLTLNDLRDITNSLAGSSLDINDINDYQLIKSIKNDLKEKSGFKWEKNYNNEKENEEENFYEINQQLSDIELINIIIPSINEKLNGKTIEEFKEILTKYSKNQPKLLILFENKKGLESSKEEIRSIIDESFFEIFYDNDNSTSYELRYNCRCLFKERTNLKSFKDLLILQQLASLSQNKEKKEENKILNTFIDLIEIIKDILSIIDNITYKGFPQEFYYIINVKNGESNCKDMNVQSNKIKSISEEKFSLKKLLKKINKYQIDSYKNSIFLKFFYGQQLAIFNQYLKQKIGKSSIKNEVSNLIYYIIGNKYKVEPDNFLYSSSFSNSIEFNIENTNIDNQNNVENDNIEVEKNSIIDTSNLNINTEMTYKTMIYSQEFSTMDQNIYEERRTIAPQNKTQSLKRTIIIPLLKQGSDKELESIMKDIYDNIENYLKEIMNCNNYF